MTGVDTTQLPGNMAMTQKKQWTGVEAQIKVF